MRLSNFLATLLTSFLASAALLSLASCIFGGNESRRLTHVETGLLEDLPRVHDSAVTMLQWRLKLDEDAGVKGECNYTGYLGDSNYVDDDVANPDLLYTNTAMGGTHKADLLVSQGVLLSLDTAAWQGDSLTHYRAEFRCRY